MHRHETIAAVTAAFLLVVALFGAAARFVAQDAGAVEGASVTRVLHTPPKPKRALAPAGPVSTPECPQMDNPGGLEWRPSADAGPWPTSGTVSIPRFAVKAPIVRVGVDQNAKMVVPHNARDVAWLDQGPIPGRTNNVVLAGHINYSRVAGSFSRLTQLQPGEIVSVEMDGKRWDFRVTWNCLFDRQTTQAEQIMGRTNVPSVTLISCGGVFERGAGTHNKRVAVRAELVDA